MHYLLLASFLWGSSFIAGKYAYQIADPALVVLMRLAIAALCLLPSLYKIVQQRGHATPLPLGRLIFLGFLTYPLTFMLQFMGLNYTSASSATTMIGVEPLMVVLMGYCFFKERVVFNDIILSILALVGVVLVVGVADDPDISVFGCMLVLSSTVVVAWWLRLSKQVLAYVDVTTYTTITLISGLVTCIPIALLLTQNWRIEFSITGSLAILYLGVGCSLVAGWIWNKGLEKVRANTGGIFLALEPIFGVIMAVVLLDESIGVVALAGIILVIVAAMVSVVWQSNPREV